VCALGGEGGREKKKKKKRKKVQMRRNSPSIVAGAERPLQRNFILSIKRKTCGSLEERRRKE
jgi:hypothetical protein